MKTPLFMSHSITFQSLTLSVMGLCLLLGTASLEAREKGPASKTPPKSVDMFDAMKEGQLTVKVVPKDATQATVVFQNRTGQPLQVRLPAAFVGRPVLAQNRGAGAAPAPGGGIGGPGFGNNQGGGRNNQQNQQQQGGANQSFGGGMGGMGGGMMGGMGGMGGGFFNVAPDQIRRVKISTVCLEHGKPDPRSNVPYEIVAVEEFTQDPAVAEICAMLGRGEISQTVAQAAAWHRTDGLSWEDLANKVKSTGTNQPTIMYFNLQELQLAAQVNQLAQVRTAEAAEEKSAPAEQPASDVSPGEASPGEVGG